MKFKSNLLLTTWLSGISCFSYDDYLSNYSPDVPTIINTEKYLAHGCRGHHYVCITSKQSERILILKLMTFLLAPIILIMGIALRFIFKIPIN